MSGTFASRLPFLFAAAILAAGLGDPFVESVSNTGIFGHYVDDNHLGVVPTLLAGAVIVFEVLALRFVAIVRRSASRSRGALIDVAKDVGTGSVARDFPVVFVLQLAAVFALESGEQFVVGGKLLGGAAWLGGPVLFSLIAHAVIGGTCTIALGACMRAIVRSFASLLQTVVRFIWLAADRLSGAAFCHARRTPARVRAQTPRVREIGGRAPPLLLTQGMS